MGRGRIAKRGRSVPFFEMCSTGLARYAQQLQKLLTTVPLLHSVPAFTRPYLSLPVTISDYCTTAPYKGQAVIILTENHYLDRNKLQDAIENYVRAF
jgi:hypothetical protein